MPVLAPCNQRIDEFCRFRSVSCLVLFHCRFLIPFDFTGPLNGNGKIIILCALCVSSEAGGEYKLTYLHSKARTFSLAEGLMDQLNLLKINGACSNGCRNYLLAFTLLLPPSRSA